jgi:leucyl aminopeptidase
MIHAVGRANPRAPRLIDLTWSKTGGRKDAPAVTLVGKGITFDTGGLDIKPSSAMLIMKKDMGGAVRHDACAQSWARGSTSDSGC